MRIALAILFLLLCLTVEAADIYVSQSGAGAQSGADAANALSLASVNSSWPASAGDTMHLVGTLTNSLTVGGSGSAGNPITILFETDAKISAPTFTAPTYIINIEARHDLVIDGGSNGRIECTDNGTVVANGGTHTYGHGDITAIRGTSLDNITVQNLAVWNLYDRQTNNEAVQGTGDGGGFYFRGSGIVVSNCFITGCQDSIDQIYSSTVTSNCLITACTFSNYNHAITVGSGGETNPVFLNLTITHNKFYSGDSFETADGIGDLGLHRNAIFIFNESGLAAGSGGHITGVVSNIVIAYNFIRHGANPKSTTAGSGGMFFDTYNNAATKHVRVYNNISTLVYPLGWSGGGGFAGAFGDDVLFANNTIVGWQTNGVWNGGYTWSISGTNAYAFNNISISSKGSWITTAVDTNGLTANDATFADVLSGITSDYNIFNGITGYSGWSVVIYNNDNFSVWEQGILDTLAQLQGIYGGALSSQIEPHSTTDSITLNADYSLDASSTAALGTGTNLTAWGITDDYYGTNRPASGAWDIGAVTYTTGPGGGGDSGSGIEVQAVATVIGP